VESSERVASGRHREERPALQLLDSELTERPLTPNLSPTRGEERSTAKEVGQLG
jgi:hypothetical protein